MKKKFDLVSFVSKRTILIMIVAECLIFQTLSKGLFLSSRNLSNILLQGATCSILAITMSLIIITRNSDLSAGRLLGLFGMMIAILQVKTQINSVILVAMVYALALLIGLFHGFMIGTLQHLDYTADLLWYQSVYQ